MVALFLYFIDFAFGHCINISLCFCFFCISQAVFRYDIFSCFFATFCKTCFQEIIIENDEVKTSAFCGVAAPPESRNGFSGEFLIFVNFYLNLFKGLLGNPSLSSPHGFQKLSKDVEATAYKLVDQIIHKKGPKDRPTVALVDDLSNVICSAADLVRVLLFFLLFLIG